MAARLGNVLYWLGCGIAALFALAFGAVALSPGQNATFFMVLHAVLAISSWLIGRALRYILAGT